MCAFADHEDKAPRRLAPRKAGPCDQGAGAHRGHWHAPLDYGRVSAIAAATGTRSRLHDKEFL